MKTRLKRWFLEHYSIIIKVIDYFALSAFVFSAIIGFVSGNMSYAGANCCAVLWVLIARSRENSCEFFSDMCLNLCKQFNDLMTKYVSLKKSNDKKGSLNDCK